MSRPETVFTNAVNVLKAAQKSGSNLSYVRKVFEGWRDNIPDSQIPCIILEPADIKETIPFFEEESELYFGITVTGIIKMFDKDKQIVGDTRHKGILDICEDIKKTFGGDIYLSDSVMTIQFPDTNFDYTSYPIRTVDITMLCRLRTKYKTRT